MLMDLHVEAQQAPDELRQEMILPFPLVAYTVECVCPASVKMPVDWILDKGVVSPWVFLTWVSRLPRLT
jgi:hypothetical protein